MMKKEDQLLIKRTEQAIKELEEDYARADFSSEAEKKSVKRDVCLEILTFESIIEDCKNEAESSDIDELIATLNLVYHMKLDKEDSSSALVKLDQVTSKFLSSKKYEIDVDEELLAAYRADMKLIAGINEALNLRILQLDKEKKFFIIPQVLLISKYEKYIETLSALEEKMRKNFTIMSDTVTSYIVESFHYIYLYYSYIIKYFLYTKNQIVLVDLAASIDRFIEIMHPLHEYTSLKNENLRNFYVIYELNVLKKSIIGYYE
jgi:hypothetical protein